MSCPCWEQLRNTTKSARQAALNEHTSFRVIHASAGCPRMSIRNTRGCVCVSDGNDDLATDVSMLFVESFRSCGDRTIGEDNFRKVEFNQRMS